MIDKSKAWSIVIEAAEYHASLDDPDHEVGDLQDAVREAFEFLNEGQLAIVLNELTFVADLYDSQSEEDESFEDWLKRKAQEK